MNSEAGKAVACQDWIQVFLILRTKALILMDLYALKRPTELGATRVEGIIRRSSRVARVARSTVHAADAVAPSDFDSALPSSPLAATISPQDAQLLRDLGIDESEEEEEDGGTQRSPPALSQPVASETLDEEFSFGSQPAERPPSPPPSSPSERNVRPRSALAIDVGAASRLMFADVPGAQTSSPPPAAPASAPLSVAEKCNRDFTGDNLNILPYSDVLLMKGVFSLQVLRDMCGRIPGFPRVEKLSRVMLVKHVEAFRQIFNRANADESHRQLVAPASTSSPHNLAGAEGPVPPARGDVPSRVALREASEQQASPSLMAAGAASAEPASPPLRPVLQPVGQFPPPPTSTTAPGVAAPSGLSPAVDPRLAFFAGVPAPVSQPLVPQQPVQVLPGSSPPAPAGFDIQAYVDSVLQRSMQEETKGVSNWLKANRLRSELLEWCLTPGKAVSEIPKMMRQVAASFGQPGARSSGPPSLF
eukprot:gene2238-biopygen2146